MTRVARAPGITVALWKLAALRIEQTDDRSQGDIYRFAVGRVPPSPVEVRATVRAPKITAPGAEARPRLPRPGRGTGRTTRPPREAAARARGRLTDFDRSTRGRGSRQAIVL